MKLFNNNATHETEIARVYMDESHTLTI